MVFVVEIQPSGEIKARNGWQVVLHSRMVGLGPEACDGYMLVDGTALGLGRLLERDAPAPKAKVKPKAKATAPAPAPVRAEDFKKWIHAAGGPTESFEVVAPNVMVRSLPSTQARAVGDRAA